MKTLNAFKKIFLTTCISLSALSLAHADTIIPPMDQVTFTLSAQEWAKTDKAKVTVVVNASLSKIALADMRTKIMSNLNEIAKGDWHITDFERSQDSSGLEKLYVKAEARINEAQLTGVNVEAKDISEAGINYKVENIDFTPSIADIEKVKKSLRAEIYKQTQNELAELNTVYPAQKYMLHDIRFAEFVASSAVRTQQVMMMGARLQPQASAAMNTVSNLITVTADVNLASERKVDVNNAVAESK
jgi:hypothetical protein